MKKIYHLQRAREFLFNEGNLLPSSHQVGAQSVRNISRSIGSSNIACLSMENVTMAAQLHCEFCNAELGLST